MALNFYCGVPGAGKSYHVVRYVIIEALKQKRNILTNLPLKLKEIYAAYPELSDQENVVEFIDNEKIEKLNLVVDCDKYIRWVIVIDETHDYWPSYKGITDEGFRSWISQHRHKFQDLVFITQDFSNVNKYIRTFTKERYVFQKNDSLGFGKTYMQDYFLDSQRKRANRVVRKYDPKFFAFYNSHDAGLAGSGFKEERVGQKINLMRKPFMLLLFGVVLSFVCVKAFYSKFSSDESPDIKSVKAGNQKNLSISSKPQIVSRSPSSGSDEIPSDNLSFAWCKNTARAGVGGQNYKGILLKNRSGREQQLKRAFVVVGIIGTFTDYIYLVKDQFGNVIRVKLKNDVYSISQHICL